MADPVQQDGEKKGEYAIVPPKLPPGASFRPTREFKEINADGKHVMTVRQRINPIRRTVEQLVRAGMPRKKAKALARQWAKQQETRGKLEAEAKAAASLAALQVNPLGGAK